MNTDSGILTLEEPESFYLTKDQYPLSDETYKVIGVCMEVHRILGRGFSEVIYKDALEYEFKKKGIDFEREKKFNIGYKDVILPHHYFADFTVFNKIILEVKAQKDIISEHYKQVINYLAVSKCKLGLIMNFGEDTLKFKRVIL